MMSVEEVARARVPTPSTPPPPSRGEENTGVRCSSAGKKETNSHKPRLATTLPSSNNSTQTPAPNPKRAINTLSKPPPTSTDIKKRAKVAKTLKDISLLNAVKANYRFIYRINDGIGTTNTILQKVCEERGWKEFKETSLLRPGTTPYEKAMRGATGWNLWWSYSIYQFSPYKYLRNWQFTNHNPKGFQFCNKLYLTMYMRKMQVIHGSPFDFYPLSFIVPEDYIRLTAEHFKRAAESFTEYNHNNLLGEKPIRCTSIPVPITPGSPSVLHPYLSSPYNSRVRPRTAIKAAHRSNNSSASATAAQCQLPNTRFNPVWISKPVALSQGKGIFLTTDLNSIATDKKSVVQEYITRPLLIGGYKWDVRIYVCVAAIDPLVIYIYNDGLCRFCTEKYSTKDLSRMYSHLTNASLNKLSPAYDDDKELIGSGCKWSLGKLRQHFKDRNIGDWLLWQKIMAMIVLTVIGDSLRLGYSASNRNCFDLFGFDVLVDENLKPWLLECNYSPGLGGDCKTDEVVKIPMLHELFNLLGFPDRSSYVEAQKARKEANPSGSKEDGSASPKKAASASASAEETTEVIPYDKEDITRHYFNMLLSKLKICSNESPEDKKLRKAKWAQDSAGKAEARLNDAKTIYSQNLVVQYLKNQSSSGKISKQARDQLICVAAKKLRTKLQALTNNNKEIFNLIKKEKKNKKSKVGSKSCPILHESEENSPDLADTAVPVESEVADSATSDNNTSISEADVVSPEPQQSADATKVKMTTLNSVVQKLKQDFPTHDSEAFQKLKYYFDAGVDYPMDAKTGKFKECPALISVKKDWFNPPKTEGGWIRVYPFDARTTKSPYKSSLTDIRQAVRSIEAYIKVAEHLHHQNPHETDDFFKKKMKSVTRRDTEMWSPPTPITVSRPATATKEDRPGTSLKISETDTIDENNNILNANNLCWKPAAEPTQTNDKKK